MKPLLQSITIVVALALGVLVFTAKRSAHPAESVYTKAIYAPPSTLDPAQMNDTASLVVGNLIYSGLLSFTSSLELTGDLAESWNTSADGKTLHFQLRPGLKFHDGSLITSKAVKKSLERVMSKTSKVYTYYDCVQGAEAFHRGQVDSVSGIKTLNEKEIEISLLYPFPPFLSVLAGATAKVLPETIEEKTFFAHPIGSGAFRLESQSVDGRTIQLSRVNPSPETHIREIVLKVLNEKDALQAARNGQVHDLANFPLTGKELVFSLGEEIVAPVAATWIIGLNTRFAPFKTRLSRQSFRDSLDTEAFRKEFFSDAEMATGFIPPGLPGHQIQRKPRLTKIAASKEKIKIAIPEELARTAEIKSFLEKQFQQRGWNVEVQPMAWTALMEQYSAKSLQAFLVSMNMDYPDTEFLVRNFTSDNSDNFSGLASSTIDAIVKKARATQDRMERQALYTSLATSLEEEAVTINLFYPRVHYWINRCVKGLEANILSDVYIDYKSVRLEGDCKHLTKEGA